MNSDGSNVKRISFGNGIYGTPVWSPRGDLIAFTKLHKGKFYIGVMRTDGKGERLLTENYYQEAPSIEWVALNNADVEKDKQESVIEFLETLEEDDDVQNVFSNANFSNN